MSIREILARNSHREVITTSNTPEILALVQDLENNREKTRLKFMNGLLKLKHAHLHTKNDDKILENIVNKENQQAIHHDYQKFINHQKVQNEREDQIRQDMLDLKAKTEDLFDSNRNYKSYLSQSTGHIISTPSSGDDFLIRINQKCLSAGKNLTGQQYQLDQCNPNDPKQQFEAKEINDSTSYQLFYDQKPKGEVEPFNLLVSKVNGNCLSSEEDSIGLHPCNNTKNQKWSPYSFDPRKCSMKLT